MCIKVVHTLKSLRLDIVYFLIRIYIEYIYFCLNYYTIFRLHLYDSLSGCAIDFHLYTGLHNNDRFWIDNDY